MGLKDQWDSSLYEDRHSFVWQAGSELLDLLQPAEGQRILDLGCGTGQLTAKIADSGATVVGLDSSPSMVAQARQNYPKLTFVLADARTFTFAEPFHSVFSNAALHWVHQPDQVVGRVAAALIPHGRFVLEMGARHNVERIVVAVETLLREMGAQPECPWYYPSVAEYASILERHGFQIRFAATFPRWTRLEHPERGLREWLSMFGQAYTGLVEPARLGEFWNRLEERLRPALFCDGHWWADYQRLRVVAVLA